MHLKENAASRRDLYNISVQHCDELHTRSCEMINLILILHFEVQCKYEQTTRGRMFFGWLASSKFPVLALYTINVSYLFWCLAIE